MFGGVTPASLTGFTTFQNTRDEADLIHNKDTWSLIHSCLLSLTLQTQNTVKEMIECYSDCISLPVLLFCAQKQKRFFLDSLLVIDPTGSASLTCLHRCAFDGCRRIPAGRRSPPHTPPHNAAGRRGRSSGAGRMTRRCHTAWWQDR